MLCQRCGYHYVLNPKHAPRIGDRTVLRAAARLGANDRAYTVNQVVGAIARRKRFYLGLQAKAKRRRFTETRGAIERLHSAAPIRGLLAQPSFGSMMPTNWSEPDLFDYGAERLLVVEEPVLVDLLVLSEVHLAARALVISLDGYPSHVSHRARQLVAHRPDIAIFVLHAAQAAPDETVADRARALLGSTPSSTVVDLGLQRDAARHIRQLRWARRLWPLPADCLPRSILVGGLTRAMVEGGRIDGDDASEPDPWWRAFDDDYG